MSEPTPPIPGVSRRTLARGAAWAAPAVVAASAAPLAAASPVAGPDPGLNGWVEVFKRSRNGCTLTIDGRGSYDDRGLWVFNAEPGEVSGAIITFYYPTSLGRLTWQAAAGNSGWSTLSLDGADTSVPGCYAYTTAYGGTLTYRPAGSPEPYTWFEGQPHFVATTTRSCATTFTLHARRTVTVKGTRYSFLRTRTL